MEWQGSSNGPSWQDVCDMMTALESLHGAQVSVLLNREGEAGVSNFCVTVAALAMNTRPELLGTQVVVTGRYPSVGHRTLAGLMYGMLHTLDQRVIKLWWDQQELPV